MLPLSPPEVNTPLPPAVQHFEHANNRAVDKLETVLAALKRVLENCISTLEILYAIGTGLTQRHRRQTLRE